jgi:hypothetical protein
MSKEMLTVERLVTAGFEELGGWALGEHSQVVPGSRLPDHGGVYAFAIDGVVQYVGLASKSVRSRLGFYRRPGATQATNIRLNGIIIAALGRGADVRVLVACPPDTRWNGLPVRGTEGLEAGLIKEFHLPWNVRGSTTAAPAKKEGGAPKTTISALQRVLDAIAQRPGMTELEIARTLWGPQAVQPQANPYCRQLLEAKLVVRKGGGGRADPYTYSLA